jgi:hypothetical protein
MIHKILKAFVRLFLILPLLYLLIVNIKLHYSPNIQKNDDYAINQSVIHQLNHLKDGLANGTDKAMQDIYPEGFMFLNALIGLAACDVAQTIDASSDVFQEQINLIDATIEAVLSDEGSAIFPKGLEMQHGAFYNGWASYLIGRKLAIQPIEQRDSADIQQFEMLCERMSSAYEENESPYLRSYNAGIWQADNVVCLASLSLHDKIFTPKYDTLIQDWLIKVKETLHPDIGLIGHFVIKGRREAQTPRGSSQSLMLNFLIDIDSAFAKEQFAIYKEHFLDYRFGLPGIREYPKGVIGEGDVDSGPVLLGIGGSASIVGIKTFAKYGDFKTHAGLRNSVDAFGLGMTFSKKRKYLFGALPIADAFIGWVNADNSQIDQSKTGFS